eukprot:XP_011616877.1 PREDICTED: DNA damage-induced apoptosis suppressor protein isoform X1 [Takifugu rubripes]
MTVSVRRALVDCVVLSVQDTAVFYPCCKGCFCRITIDQRDRCRCSRCGYSCTADRVEHRYRLSLKVARDGCMFGVTVFGTCLNPFFGIDASALQRLVVNLDEPVGTSRRSTLLLKAVQDCFIGRHFIFGFKFHESEPQPWIKRAVQNGSGINDQSDVIASQMILPQATGLDGCMVISYYQSLLQKAAEFELGSSDPSEIPRFPPASLLVIPHSSPGSSYSNDELWSTSRLSDSALSSQHPDSTFAPTPPWQQSLGLVTSSAEQEQDGCNRDIEDDSQVERFNSSHLQKGNGPKDHEESEETAVSPFSLGHGSPDQLMLDRHSVIQTAPGNTSVVSSEVSPGSLGHISRAMWLSTKDLTETLMLGSVAWEDLPLSDSLTEFFCEKQGCDVTESQRNAHNQRERPRITPEITPQDKISSIQSSHASKGDHLQALMDITNTSARIEADGHFSEQLCKNHVTSVSIHAKDTSSDGCNQENEEEEEHCEMEVYNCSADLFSNVDVATETPNRTVRCITKTRLPMSHKRRLSEQMNISHVTPNKPKLKQKKSDDMDNPPVTPQLHFIPPSQSTPIVTTGSPASYRCSTAVGLSSLPDCQESLDLASHTPAKINPSLCKLNPLVKSLCHCDKTTSVSCSSTFTLKRRFWNPEITKRDRLPVQVQTAAPNIPPTEKVIHRCGTSSAVVIVCGGINEMLIPPTPLARTQLRAKPRKQSPAHNSSPNVQCVWEKEQEDGRNSGETARNQDFTSLWEPSGNQDSEAVVRASLGASPCYLLDESKECDWSRDLFSDSA